MTDDEWAALTRQPPGEATLAAWADAAATEKDPVRALRAKAREVDVARRLQRQQHAVVAGTELLSHLERCAGLALPPSHEIANGFAGAAMAAMDLPEIPLAAVDELVAATERVIEAMDRTPYAASTLRARRFAISGDWDRVRAEVERVAPNVSRSNHLLHLWECPGCVLAELVLYLDAPGPEVVEQLLAPILEGHPSPWREDPRLRALVEQVYQGEATCRPSRSQAHVLAALAWLRAGEVARARSRWAAAARFGERQGVRARLVALELALADGDPEPIRAALDPILAALPEHEDAEEALLWATAAARALRRLGDAGADRVIAQARELAARLDARLDLPRHGAALEGAIT